MNIITKDRKYTRKKKTILNTIIIKKKKYEKNLIFLERVIYAKK